VDDIVVKSQLRSDLITDLTEMFTNLCKYKMKLNPTKCVFGVPAGKLLGFVISHRGMDANPDKIAAVMAWGKPTCICDIQKLTGCVAALSRFIPRLSKKALLLYTPEEI
jgi:hypothetical protein